MSPRYRNPPGKEQKRDWSPRFKNPVAGVKASRFIGRIQKAVSQVVDVANCVNDMGATPSLRNYVALGVVALAKLTESAKFDPHDDPRFMPVAISWDYVRSLRKIYEQMPQTLSAEGSDTNFQVTELESGEMVVFQVAAKVDNVTHDVWVIADEPLNNAESLRLIGREIWKFLGTRIQATAPATILEGNQTGEILPWSPGQIYRSTQAEKISARAQAFLKAGHNRATILHGQPGTGKSCIVRAIADDMAQPTLFLEQRQMRNMSSWSFHFLLELLQPSVLIVDDLDRIPETSTLLGSVDRIREVVDLFMVTVNNMNSFDSAVIRAGRFDDIIEVTRVREPLDIVPDAEESLLKEIEDWPISYVEELRVRLEVLGRDALESELPLLRERVKFNNRTTQKDASSPRLAGQGKDVAQGGGL